MSTMSMATALNAALRNRMEADPKVLVMGLDVGKLGGVFRITDGLQKDFGEDRVIDAPLGESGIVGSAVGLAIRGYRPVCEIQFDGFVYPAFDQIVCQLAKFHNRSLGQVKMPVTIRIPYGGGIGAVEHHSESPEAYFAHTAGLKVVTCSNPSDAYWMLRQSIECDDPVIFFEPKRRYWAKGDVDVDAQPAALHKAHVVRPGRDATLVAYGPMVATALDAARADRHRHGGAVGDQDRPAGGGARGLGDAGDGRRDRGPGPGTGLLLPGGSHPAGRRLRYPVPGQPDRGGVVARRRPDPRRRRTHTVLLAPADPSGGRLAYHLVRAPLSGSALIEPIPGEQHRG
jgi:pyruvate/2-oxoglutarate/acetoin dehydrogenase E1 component